MAEQVEEEHERLLVIVSFTDDSDDPQGDWEQIMAELRAKLGSKKNVKIYTAAHTTADAIVGFLDDEFKGSHERAEDPT